jgi:hypothetical protein
MTTGRRKLVRFVLCTVGQTTPTGTWNRHILRLQEELAEFVTAVPTFPLENETVAREFFQNIILKFGIQNEMQTEQGSDV